jgi:hypothetical protein
VIENHRGFTERGLEREDMAGMGWCWWMYWSCVGMVFQDYINDHMQHYRAHYDQIIRSAPLEYASLCPTRQHVRRSIPSSTREQWEFSGPRPGKPSRIDYCTMEVLTKELL